MIEAAEIGRQENKRRLPDGWRWVRLREVCKVNPRRPPSLQLDGEAPTTFVPMSAVDEQSGTVVRAEVRRFSEVQKGYTYFDEGDVLFAKITPCMQNGKHAIARNLIGGLGFGTTEFHVLRPGSAITSEWIHHFVRQPIVLETATAYFTGAVGQQRVPESYLSDLEIPLPPLSEQKRIAAILNEQMAAVGRARAAAEAQLDAAKALPAAYLRAVFNSPEAQRWTRRTLAEVCDFQGGTQPPKSTFKHKPEPGYVRLLQIQDFKTEAYAVYVLDDPRLNKCDESDVLIGRYGASVGRILRGKAGAYNVAIVKTLPKEAILSKDFLFYVLQGEAFQSLVNEVCARAAQAGFNKADVGGLQIPIPRLSEQQRIAAMLSEQMAAAERTRKVLEEQLDTINKIPAALLRRAFSGELAPAQRKKASPMSRQGVVFKRGAIASYIINRLGQRSTFGRVQLQKILYLTEAHVGVDLAGEYFREAAGPLDSGFLYGLESLAQKQGWFTKHSRKKALGYYYRPGPNISGRIRAAQTILGNHRNEMDRLLNLFANIDTRQAEIVTTLFAAWNDFLLDSQNFTDQEIIQEVKTNWHKAKERILNEKLKAGLNWLKEQRITPQGIGPRTMVKKKRRGSSGNRSKRRK